MNSVTIGGDVNVTTNIQFEFAWAAFVFLFLWQLAMMGCFAPVSSRSCYQGTEFHNTKRLVTVNSLAVVLCSWDMTRVTQVEYTVNTRRILLWEIALGSKDL